MPTHPEGSGRFGTPMKPEIPVVGQFEFPQARFSIPACGMMVP